jgi:hypothetical protein
MNYINKYADVTAYDADNTKQYPNVSYITSGNSVVFAASAPVVIEDKLMVAFHIGLEGESGQDIVLVNGGTSEWENTVTAITVNDVAVDPLTDILVSASQTDTDYLVKYDLADGATGIGDWLSGDLGGGFGSASGDLDVLIPSFIDGIDNLPSNAHNIVVKATTPPTVSVGESTLANFGALYVPDEAISAYESAWGEGWQSQILGISQYEGNLPV